MRDRTHEECAECSVRSVDPPACSGHEPGEVACRERTGALQAYIARQQFDRYEASKLISSQGLRAMEDADEIDRLTKLNVAENRISAEQIIRARAAEARVQELERQCRALKKENLQMQLICDELRARERGGA